METTATAPSAATLNQSCFWELDLYTGRINWSDALCALLNLQKPGTPTLEQLTAYYEPENLRTCFWRAVHQGISFMLNLPSVLPSGKVISVYTFAAPVYDDYGRCVAVKGVLATAQNAEPVVKSVTKVTAKTNELDIVLENFAWVISHNLRSHTSNLQMVLESINQKTSTQKMRNLIGDIRVISRNLNQTVGYLNTLTKI
ncbi:MAG: hypothetical protein EOP42_13110 [Sphingobacteriaceae bacterium]|nr:MAG: hypothetical protein EOP42_13110 [Sphingobacteriaceae bacterium]